MLHLQRMSWQLDAMNSDIVSMGWRPDGPGATWKLSTHGRVPHGLSAGGPGQSPHIPQGKGVPVGRNATQTRHSGFDTSSVMSVSVCARARTKSLRSSSRVVSSHSRVWGGQGKRPPHTQRTRSRQRWASATVPSGTGRAAQSCTLDRAQFPPSRKKGQAHK